MEILDSDVITFRSVCPPEYQDRQTAAKIFTNLLGKTDSLEGKTDSLEGKTYS